MKNKDKNLEIQVNNQNKLRELEQMYVENKIDNMFTDIEKRKEQLVGEMVEYANKRFKSVCGKYIKKP